MSDLAVSAIFGAKLCHILGLNPEAVTRIEIVAGPPTEPVEVLVHRVLRSDEAEAIIEESARYKLCDSIQEVNPDANRQREEPT